MPVDRKDVAPGTEPPKNFNGFALDQAVCEHGEPHVIMQVWKNGQVIAQRMMGPEELIVTAQGFVDAAAACESLRQLKTYTDGTIFSSGHEPPAGRPWTPSGPDDQAGFGPWRPNGR